MNEKALPATRRRTSLQRCFSLDGSLPRRFRVSCKHITLDDDILDLNVYKHVEESEVPDENQTMAYGSKLYLFTSDLLENTLDSVSFYTIIALTIWSLIIVGLHEAVFDCPSSMPVKAEAVLLFSSLLAFLLVFRNNQAYQRWQEGRSLWGDLMGEMIMLNQRAGAWVRPEAGIKYSSEIRQCVARYSITLLHGARTLLRNEPLDPDDLKGILSESEVDRLNHTEGYSPYQCLDIIRAALFHSAVRVADDSNPAPASTMSPAREGALESTLSAVTKIMTDCVRIRGSNFPFSYSLVLEILTYIYLLALPIIVVDDVTWYAIPSTFLVSMFYISLLNIATALEDPFGHDVTDLELDNFCVETELQIFSRYNASKDADQFMTYLSWDIEEGNHFNDMVALSSSVDSYYDNPTRHDRNDADYSLIAPSQSPSQPEQTEAKEAKEKQAKEPSVFDMFSFSSSDV
eukprot:CAMPEP_0174968626 /NCGR_PEP_ID=MMETSP0004_2-20121128/8245_1 /TAXON_ID=420556 /ORGANISM="Ochromonas sp., Strain CCMP1393" /LENGTH=459 /DNA_ID=CAMNT_0016217893 /DNA_START=42 /DNA_END=1421 /DNA_ORIENTATION=+